MRKILLTLIIVTISIWSFAWYQTAKANIYGSSLVAWLRFDNNDISGTTVEDKSKTGNNGTLQNGPTSGAAGKSGQSLQFDGSNDCVQIATTGLDFQYNSTFSISLWFKVRTTAPLAQMLLQKLGEGGNYTGYGLALYDTVNSDTLDFVLINNAFAPTLLNVRTMSNAIAVNTWYHVVVTYSGNSLASGTNIYVNGKNQTLSVINNSLGSNSITTTNYPTIGCRYAAGGDLSTLIHPLNGNIDDVRVYDRVLSASEVTGLYLQGVPQFNNGF